MAYETEVLLKSVYRVALKTRSLDEVIMTLKTMLTEEQAAYVEKLAAQSSEKNG